MGARIPKNGVLTPKRKISLSRIVITTGLGCYIVRGGVIHAYKSKRIACESAFSSEEVFKAIIPARAKYLFGRDGEVVTTKLKLVKDKRVK